MVVDEGPARPHCLYGRWGSTKDVPMHVVHDEDKGVHTAGMYAKSRRWMHWGSVGGGLWQDEGRLCGRSHNVCHPTHKTEHTASGEPWANSLATEHHMMEVQTAW